MRITIKRPFTEPWTFCFCCHRRRIACSAVFVSIALACIPQTRATGGPQSKVLNQGASPVIAVHFTPSGKELISATKNGEVVMWNLEAGRPLWTVRLRIPPKAGDYTQTSLNAMDLSYDGRTVVVSYDRFGVDRNLVDQKLGNPGTQKDTVREHRIVLISAEDGALQKDISEANDRATEVLFSSKGVLFLVTAALPSKQAMESHQLPGTALHSLSVDTGRELSVVNSNLPAAGAALSPDGAVLALAGSHFPVHGIVSFAVELYDTNTGRLTHSSTYELKGRPALGFSPDSRVLAVAGPVEGGVQLDLLTTDGYRSERAIIPGRSTATPAVAFIRETHAVAVAGGTLELVGTDDTGAPLFRDKGGSVLTVDETTGKQVSNQEFDSLVTCLARSGNGESLAVGMHNGQIIIEPLVH